MAAVTDFRSRNELLLALLSMEAERTNRLQDVLDGVKASLSSQQPTSRSERDANGKGQSIVLQVAGGSSRRPHASSTSAISVLQREIDQLHKSNESLRHEVLSLHNQAIQTTRRIEHLQATRTAAEQNRNRVEGIQRAMEQVLGAWKQLLQKCRSVAASQAGGTDGQEWMSPQGKASAAELRSLEQEAASMELRVADVKRRGEDTRSELQDELDALQACDADIQALKCRCDQLRSDNDLNRADTIAAEKEKTKKLDEETQRLAAALEAEAVRRERFLNAYAAKFIAATMFPPADSLPEHMEEKIATLRAQAEDVSRMSEAMALLKSTIVRFDTDLKRLRSVQRLVESELENVFKASHNEVKVAVTMCLAKEDVRRFARGGHTCDEWPLTQHMLERKFPQHKLETVNGALQDMVVAWDGMSAEAKARMTTAQDVVANAHLLFMLACYVSLQRSQKWAAKYQQVMELRLPKVASGGGS